MLAGIPRSCSFLLPHYLVYGTNSKAKGITRNNLILVPPYQMGCQKSLRKQSVCLPWFMGPKYFFHHAVTKTLTWMILFPFLICLLNSMVGRDFHWQSMLNLQLSWVVWQPSLQLRPDGKFLVQPLGMHCQSAIWEGPREVNMASCWEGWSLEQRHKLTLCNEADRYLPRVGECHVSFNRTQNFKKK